MAIFAQSVITTALNAKDAYEKIEAYKTLFNIVTSEVLTWVSGVFYDKQGDCAFLNNGRHSVTITARSIKWYDPACGKEITIVPADGSFELTLRV